MNESFTVQGAVVEPARTDLAAGTPGGATAATQRPQEGGRISSAELAQKVLKMTGSVRLASRSAHHWHHCGINE